MATGFVAGKVGYVYVDDGIDGPQAWKLGKWSYKPRAKIVPRNNFMSGGLDENLAGFIGADIRIEGPYSIGEMPVTVGETYLVYLGLEEDGPTEFQCNIRVSDFEVANDSEDAPNIIIVAVSNGDLQYSTTHHI